jgi:predicted DNA-binding transcriptional regulator YafY
VGALRQTLGFTQHQRKPAVAADTGVVLTLATAASQHQRVRLRYRSHADQDSERDLDPYGLVLHSGRWYVTGRDGKTGEVRTFRVDRIGEALLSGVSFDPPADFDPVQHVTRSLAAVPYAHEIEVVLATTLENARRRIPPTVATLAETEGGVLLTGRAEHLPGLAAMLAGLGWPFTVRRPAALVTEVRALSDRLRAWSES